MNIAINRDTCIGCGLCASIASDVYEMDGEGLAIVKAQPDATQQDAAKQALDSCPVSAILQED